MKRLILIMSMVVMMSFLGYSAPQVISQCPVTITNDTEYIMTPTFNFDKVDCFDFTGINVQNVVIDGNGSVYSTAGASSSIVHFGGGSGVVSGVEVKDITILDFAGNIFVEFETDLAGYVENVEIRDNVILKSISNGNFLSFGDRLSVGGNNRYYNGTFIIENNYYQGDRPFILLDSNSAGTATGIHIFEAMVIQENDVLHGGIVSYSTTGGFVGRGGSANTHQWHMNGQWLFQNNNYVGGGKMFSSEPYLFGSHGYTNNFDGSISPALDAVSPFGITEAPIARTSSNGITYSNQVENTASYSRSGHPQYDKEAYVAVPWVSPWVNVIANLAGSGFSGFSGYHVFLSQDTTIDGSTGIVYFYGFTDSVLDLSNLVRTTGITMTNTRGFRMGTDNTIYGGGVNPLYLADITTSGTITLPYSGSYYSNNWHLIEYDNGLNINNVKFNMNAVADYGIVRKRDSATDGIDFVFEDNYVDFNYVPTSADDRPQFVVGALSTFNNNQFDMPSASNLSLIGGGFSTGIGGGHVITGNEFNGGGKIFSMLQDGFAGINYPSKFIHNEFKQSGTMYAQPFDPNVDTNNLMANPQLNGSYYYKTLCTHYEFNVGNWYEDWSDSGFYNDTNADGIHDEFLGIDYIERGADYNGDPIRDYRSVVPYPYDFAGNIGTLSPDEIYDVCALFNYNIISPTEQNYTSGFELTSNWEYVATAYPTMQCKETLNGETTLFENVETGDNKGTTYETTDGAGTLQVTCCDTIQCDNIVKVSEPVDFCIGSCATALVVLNTSEPVAPVLGCTNSTATNYNPLATQDDGSCTFAGDGDDGGGVGDISDVGVEDLFSGSASETTDNINGLFGLMSIPYGWLIIIGFVMLGLAILSFVITLPFLLVGGQK